MALSLVLLFYLSRSLFLKRSISLGRERKKKKKRKNKVVQKKKERFAFAFSLIKSHNPRLGAFFFLLFVYMLRAVLHNGIDCVCVYYPKTYMMGRRWRWTVRWLYLYTKTHRAPVNYNVISSHTGLCLSDSCYYMCIYNGPRLTLQRAPATLVIAWFLSLAHTLIACYYVLYCINVQGIISSPSYITSKSDSRRFKVYTKTLG